MSNPLDDSNAVAHKKGTAKRPEAKKQMWKYGGYIVLGCVSIYILTWIYQWAGVTSDSNGRVTPVAITSTRPSSTNPVVVTTPRFDPNVCREGSETITATSTEWSRVVSGRPHCHMSYRRDPNGGTIQLNNGWVTMTWEGGTKATLPTPREGNSSSLKVRLVENGYPVTVEVMFTSN